MVDTGSSDLALPNQGINGYTGPTLTETQPAGASTITASYGIGTWTGFGVQGTVGLVGTPIQSNNAPFIAMQSQTSILTHSVEQGLFGVAYDPLATYNVQPKTVMDAWMQSGVLNNDQIAFYGCPSNLMSQAYIDFGNTDPSLTCNPSGTPVAIAKSPSKDYYSIDLRAVTIGTNSVPLPATFQKVKNSLGSNTWTIVDSCTSAMMLPQSITQQLVNVMIASGGMPQSWSQKTLSDFVNAKTAVSNANFNYAVLPKISFDIAYAATGNSTFRITIGPRQYIQSTADGFCKL